MPFWQDYIGPAILNGNKVLISAHGNSLRALVKLLDNISEKGKYNNRRFSLIICLDIVELNIPTGLPLVYELDENLKPIKKYYLGI